MLPFLLGHIVSEKHGGSSDVENLAFTCPYCGRAKGSDLASIDPETELLTSLYNPRTQTWSEHFELDGAEIIPLTPFGRVTVQMLRMNHPDRIQEREMLIGLDMYPQVTE